MFWLPEGFHELHLEEFVLFVNVGNTEDIRGCV